MSEAIVKGALAFIFIIAFVPVILTSINNIGSSQHNTELQQMAAQKDTQIVAVAQQRDSYKAEAEFYKGQYESLVNTSITKKDVDNIQSELDVVQSQLAGLQTNTGIINQNIVNFYDIKNVYKNLYISIIINFVFVGLIFLDFIIFEFSITKAVIGYLEGKYRKVRSWMKRAFTWLWNKITNKE